jgi:hypothetical protein
VTWLSRHYPWLFGSRVVGVHARLVSFPRLGGDPHRAGGACLFFLGEEQVGVIAGITLITIKKLVAACCCAPRPFDHLLFWVYDLGWGSVELLSQGLGKNQHTHPEITTITRSAVSIHSLSQSRNGNPASETPRTTSGFLNVP